MASSVALIVRYMLCMLCALKRQQQYMRPFIQFDGIMWVGVAISFRFVSAIPYFSESSILVDWLYHFNVNLGSQETSSTILIHSFMSVFLPNDQ